MILQTDGETTLQPHPGGCIECKILKYYQPSTLSCVMEVEIDTSSSQRRHFVLKSYDHRFATQLRKDEKVEPFSPVHESAYWDYVKSGGASKFLAWLYDDESLAGEEFKQPWDKGQDEIHLYATCLDMYESECTIYDRLKDLQGNNIPRFFARVRLPLASPPLTDTLPAEFCAIKGILLELIDGFTLSEMIDQAPKEAWQGICDQAIRVIEACNDHEILNEDVRPSNVMVTRLQPDDAYRVVVLDFAQCRLREPEESIEEWGRAKWTQDEVGAIGAVMKHRLEKIGFELSHTCSLRYLEWASHEDD